MPHRYPPPPSPEELGLLPPGAAGGGRRSGGDLPKPKRFRFQLLAGWIADSFPPCAVADVGGGKGLLTWLLNEAGFQAEVVDPVDQPLPSRYRDLATGRRVRLHAGDAARRRIERPAKAGGGHADGLATDRQQRDVGCESRADVREAGRIAKVSYREDQALSVDVTLAPGVVDRGNAGTGPLIGAPRSASSVS